MRTFDTMTAILTRLNVISYNCRGLNIEAERSHKRVIVDSLIDRRDIICLQETFLSKQENAVINTFCSDCRGIGVSHNDFSSGIRNSRKWVAILWKTCFDDVISPLEFDIDWLVGVNVTSSNRSSILLNVYLPYECPEN